MTGREEKILLIAKESADESDILLAISQVVNNCCMEDGFDVDAIPIFDLEFFFLKIRCVSIDNLVSITYEDGDDKKEYTVEIDLSEVTIKGENYDKPRTIKLSDNAGIQFHYPSASLYADKEFLSMNPVDLKEELIVRCINKIYNGDEIFDPSTSTSQEKKDFINSLDVKTLAKISKFFDDIPSMYYKVEYTNSLGTKREIELTTLLDFFTFR